MDVSVLSGEGAALLLTLLVSGLAVGFLAGLLGVGGGAVLVPILYEVFLRTGVDDSVLIHMTLGTSFAVIVPTALRSLQSHWRHGSVDETALCRLAPFVLAGVVAGVGLLTSVTGDVLQTVWAVCASVLALRMLLAGKSNRQTHELPKGRAIEFAAFAIGLLSTLMSVGGGIFFVAMFTMLGWPMLRSVATSSGFGPVIAVPALLGYVYAGFGNPQLPGHSIGYVDLMTVAIVTPLSILAAPVGVKAAHKISRRALEICFATFLFASAARLGISLLG